MNRPSKTRWRSMRHRRRDGSGRPTALMLSKNIEVVRSLALAGIRCGIVAGPDDPARFSRYTTTIFNWDWGKSSGERDDKLVERLMQYGQSQPEPPVLFYPCDDSLLFVSRHREELSEAFRFTIADAATVEALVDKVRFSTLAEELSLPVPATLILVPGSDPSPPDMSHLGFPLIIKPHRRNQMWGSVEPTHKALRVDDMEEFQSVWPRLSTLGQTIVAQQHVGGPESRVESYHVYIDRDHQIVAEFTGRKLRTLPASYGHTTALTITNANDVARRGRELARVFGLLGVAKFDFKRSPDGELYLLEVNPRFNLWHHPGARAGVNIPALVYSDLTGRPRPEIAQPRAGVRWCHPQDFSAARESNVPFVRWFPWILGCEAKAYWSWNDPMPFVGTVVSRIMHGKLGVRDDPFPEHTGSAGSTLNSAA
jgi:D-aspartate ligase